MVDKEVQTLIPSPIISNHSSLYIENPSIKLKKMQSKVAQSNDNSFSSESLS